MSDHDHAGAHGHEHGAGHRHPAQADFDDTLTYPRKLEIALRELLIEKGVFTADEVRATIEEIEGRSPATGSRIVARAWTDEAFKTALLADATAACLGLGIDMSKVETKVVAVENTPDVHNVIVCTLCSCYPRILLGLPPAWYKSFAYRSRMVSEPRRVLKEFGLELPDGVAVRVHDSTADLRYLVIPMRPAGTENMAEADLERLVTRDSMIGVTRALAPGAAA